MGTLLAAATVVACARPTLGAQQNAADDPRSAIIEARSGPLEVGVYNDRSLIVGVVRVVRNP